jgi:hypothetical protein
MDYVCGITGGPRCTTRDKQDVQRGLRGASADITWTLRGHTWTIQPAGFTRAPRVVREYRVENVECTVYHCCERCLYRLPISPYFLEKSARWSAGIAPAGFSTRDSILGTNNVVKDSPLLIGSQRRYGYNLFTIITFYVVVYRDWRQKHFFESKFSELSSWDTILYNSALDNTNFMNTYMSYTYIYYTTLSSSLAFSLNTLTYDKLSNIGRTLYIGDMTIYFI